MSRIADARCSAPTRITQKQVAAAAGISLRTYQEFEQGRQDINKAQAFTVFRLACALTNLTGRKYTVEDLLEFMW